MAMMDYGLKLNKRSGVTLNNLDSLFGISTPDPQEWQGDYISEAPSTTTALDGNGIASGVATLDGSGVDMGYGSWGSPSGQISHLATDGGLLYPKKDTTWDSDYSLGQTAQAETSASSAAADSSGGGNLGMGLGLGLKAGAALGAAYSAYSSAKTAAYVAASNAKMADAAAGVMELGAEMAFRSGESKIAQMTQRAAQLKANQRSKMASSGAAIGVGNSAEILASTDVGKEQDKWELEANALAEAWQYKSKAIEYKAQAAGLRDIAAANNSAAGFNAFSTLLNQSAGLLNSFSFSTGSNGLSIGIRG